MKKTLPGHLVGFGELQELLDYENHIYRGGAISVEEYDVYKEIPSESECDRLCAALSSEVVVYKRKIAP